MYIVSKNREEMYNLDRATNIYISSDGCSVKICVDGTRGGQLGKYNSSEETQEAMAILVEEMKNARNNNIIHMATEDVIRTKIRTRNKQENHRVNGKKKKGYGGS
jgi:hypothetical protein